MDRDKFLSKPRRVNDEMPPIFPYQVWIRDCAVINCKIGVHAENADGVIIDNLVTRQTSNPVVIRNCQRVLVKGLNVRI